MKHGGEDRPDVCRTPTLLECTVRDGNYAVDFRFTVEDTKILTGLLAGLGVQWIEVGHGVGLSAARAGKGDMPASDADLIKAAKSASSDALIGAFCIPGIAVLDDLDAAREAGLDFVRIGYDATDVEKTVPFIERARLCGLTPFVNLMKSYVLTPEEFGERAAYLSDAGAHAVYCVDSAGCMLPDQVTRFVTSARDMSSVALGLHAHNNLQLAMANALAAFEAGAEYIDTTVYGLGRSAGNVPTEVAVAVFDMLGIDTGLDLFEVMDVADTYLRPLMKRLELYDMNSVAMGHAGFHSSFFETVDAVAKKRGVDVRRLLTSVAHDDRVQIDPRRVEELASALPARNSQETPVLLGTGVAGLGSDALSTNEDAVVRLGSSLSTASSKYRSAPVIELRAAVGESAGLLMTEFVLSDEEVALGRVTFGSLPVLEGALKAAVQTVRLFLLDEDGGDWLDAAKRREVIDQLHQRGARVAIISSRQLLDEHVATAVRIVAAHSEVGHIVFVGSASPSAQATADRLCTRVTVLGGVMSEEDACVQVETLPEAIDLLVLLAHPSTALMQSLIGHLTDSCTVVALGAPDDLVAMIPSGIAIVTLDGNDAYRGLLPRITSIGDAYHRPNEATR